MNPTQSTGTSSGAAAKLPPKFVPTLTEVVQLPPGLLPVQARVQALSHPASDRVSDAPVDTPVDTAPAELSAPGSGDRDAISDLLVHRVMQRVDEHLARDLRVAVAQLVVGHMQSLTPLLRTEIDRVVRTSVENALAKELGANGGPDSH